MIKTVYYLANWQNHTRVRYYTTRTGARIAMRLHNLHLGFRERTSRAQMGQWEYEVYCIVEDGERKVVHGTYCVVEDCIESPEDLLS
jgi:hypothetical protein